MAFSIEARLPFLDHRIVELFLRMPGGYKMRDGWTKPFIRDAMKGVMPEPVRLRVDKKGFVTPENIWYKAHLRRIKDLLLSNHTPLQIWVDREQLSKWLQSDSYERVGERGLWRLLAIHFWMERFALA